jgi:predicted amidophosphoribosyltransferase
MILAYKERGLRVLASPLGTALAHVVTAGLAGVARSWPLVLVPVPASAAAVRARHGDHMRALARHAATELATDGWVVRVHQALCALPKADSAHLDRRARADAARSAFALRPTAALRLRDAARDGIVVALDDVLTTGATLAAVARQLARAGAPVAFAATLAATRLRGVDSIAPIALARSGDRGDWTLATS